MPWTRSFWVDTGGCEGLGLRVWSVILDIYNDYILHILHIFGGWFVVSTYPPKNPVSKHTIHRVNCGETSRGSVRFERLRYRFWSRFSTLPHCTNVSACKSIHGKGRLIHCKKIWWCLQRVDALGSKADLPHKSSRCRERGPWHAWHVAAHADVYDLFFSAMEAQKYPKSTCLKKTPRINPLPAYQNGLSISPSTVYFLHKREISIPIFIDPFKRQEHTHTYI